MQGDTEDTQEHKPNAAPLLKYVELSKTDHRKALYIEDSEFGSKLPNSLSVAVPQAQLAVCGGINMTVNARKMREWVLF